MKFQRQAVRIADSLHPRGRTVALRADEVSRHAVRLVVVDRARGEVKVVPFAVLPSLLRVGDLVVVNDAATLPASIYGTTARAERFELRLSAGLDGSRLHGVVFGDGDYHTKTEDRAAPPKIVVGEKVTLGGIEAVVESLAARRICLVATVGDDELWQALYAAATPIQYAHRVDPLPLYAVQTAYAARPWSVEMPSAGRALTWDVLLGLRRAGIQIATLTHAAGLSSTGDDALDRALPWPERYELPQATLDAIAATRARGNRVIAIGTTVVRALESAAIEAETRDAPLALHAGSGIATLRLDPTYRPRLVDGLVSGLHVPGESHFELLSAFAPRALLVRAIALAADHGMSGHELGDATLLL
ncbi:MAG: S-adenosylmethionine:tRNA ribosyltransferase-isomerase [Kofleriaceae bacterium]